MDWAWMRRVVTYAVSLALVLLILVMGVGPALAEGI